MGKSPICCSRMVLIPVMGRQEHLGERVSKECILLAIKFPHKTGFTSFSLQTRKRRRWAEGVEERVLHEGVAGALSVWPIGCFASQAMPGARRTPPSDDAGGLGATGIAEQSRARDEWDIWCGKNSARVFGAIYYRFQPTRLLSQRFLLIEITILHFKNETAPLPALGVWRGRLWEGLRLQRNAFFSGLTGG